MDITSEPDKQAIIDYIAKHKPEVNRKELDNLSLGSLVLIKVHIEIELCNQKGG